MANKKTTKTKAAVTKTTGGKPAKRNAAPTPHKKRPTSDPQPVTAVAEPTPVPALTPETALTTSAALPAPKLSAIEAAVKVLGESGQPMNCQEMITAMATKGYWTSPGGKTPSSTLYASILRELKLRGAQARFQKTQRGKFTLNPRS